MKLSSNPKTVKAQQQVLRDVFDNYTPESHRTFVLRYNRHIKTHSCTKAKPDHNYALGLGWTPYYGETTD